MTELVSFEVPFAAAEQFTEEEKRRQGFIMGLVQVAKFFNDNPHLMLPTWAQEINVFPTDEATSTSQLTLYAKAMGNAKKVYLDSLFSLDKEYGDRLKLRFIAYREQVCERIVVGKEIVPAHTKPAEHIPEREVEKVEWRCHSILSDKAHLAIEEATQ